MKKTNLILIGILAVSLGMTAFIWNSFLESNVEEKPKVAAGKTQESAPISIVQNAGSPERSKPSTSSSKELDEDLGNPGHQFSSPTFASDSEIERLLLGEFNAEEAFQRGERYLDKEISDKADINDWDQYSWCFKIDDGASFIIDRTPITVDGKEVRLCQLRLERKETMNLAGVMRDSFTEYFGLSLATDGTIEKATYFAEFHVAGRENRIIGIEPLEIPLIVHGLTWEIKDGTIYAKQSGMMKGRSVNPRDFPSVQIVGDLNLSKETQERFRDVYVEWLEKVGMKK